MATGGGHEGGATFIQVTRISGTKVEVLQSSGVNSSSLKSGGRRVGTMSFYNGTEGLE